MSCSWMEEYNVSYKSVKTYPEPAFLTECRFNVSESVELVIRVQALHISSSLESNCSPINPLQTDPLITDQMEEHHHGS